MTNIIAISGTIWVKQGLIAAKCGLKDEYLRICRTRYRGKLESRQNPTPDTGAAWRFARFGKEWYYDYNRIPDRAPAFYRSKLPSLQELMEGSSKDDQKQGIIDRLQKALDYDFKDYLHKYNADNQHKIQLAKGAASLAALTILYKTAPDIKEFIQQAAEACYRMSVPYLPSSPRRLRDRIEAHLKGQDLTELVTLPRVGNQNALRVADPAIYAWMLKLRAMPQNWTHAHIIRMIEQLCAMHDKVCPSWSWFYNELSEARVKFATSKRWAGKGRHGNKHTGYTPIADPLFAGDVWQIDGTRVNLVDHLGTDGRQQFLYVIALRDGYSGDILGVHFDTKEDRYGYYNVLKMAVNNTGYLPYELVIDRFPGHNTEEWQEIENRMRRQGTKVTYTSVATGKAQIERWFGTLQTVFMQGSKYYYGEGVRSTREYAHRSAEYLVKVRRQAKQDGWDFDAAWREGMRIIEAYRNTRYSEYSRKRQNIEATPAELHQEGEKPNTYAVAPWQYADIFGLQKTVRIQRGGLLRVEILRVEYTFRIEDLEIIENHESVTLAYELDDLSKVYLFTAGANREYLGEAVEQRAVQIYGPNADMAALSKSKAHVARVSARRDEILERVADTITNSEVDLLMEGFLSKNIKESAESAYLIERQQEWLDHGQPRLPAESIDFDIRDTY